jgi:hypothetical protein
VVGIDFVRAQRDAIDGAIRHLRTGEGHAPWSEAVMASITTRM